MSFNLRGALGWDGWNSWPLRRRLVKEVLDRYRPSVLGLQEVGWPAQRFLARVLPAHVSIPGPRTGRLLPGVHNAVFLSKRDVDRSPPGAESDQSFWLSETPDRRSRAWGASCPRAATCLSLSHQGRPFVLVNTHLDHESAWAREESARLLLERLALLGWPATPAVLCGDFNCDPGGRVHGTLLRQGFRDTFQAAGGPDDDSAFTFHGFQGRLHPAERRIDWILCSPPLRAVSAFIVRDARPPRYPSDHHPVVADLVWTPGPDAEAPA